jgi:hypothetical protein
MMPFPRKRTCLSLVFAVAMSTTVRATAADATKEAVKHACIAASERAQEDRRTGKYQEARGEIATCMDAACPGPIREDCTRLLTEVEAAMPSLVLAAQDAAGNDLSAVRVTMDGQPFAEKLDGRPIALNPGEHHFVLRAPDLPAVEKTLVVLEGEKGRREHFVFGSASAPTGATPSGSKPEPVPSPPPVAAPPPAPPVTPVTPVAPAPTEVRAISTPPAASALPSSPGGGVPTEALVAGGIGVAGLLAATVTGVLALSKGSDLDGECTGGATNCPPSAQSDISNLHTMQTLTNIGLGVGIGGVVVGGILWLAAGHPEKAPPVTGWLGVGSAGVAGRF